MISNDAYDDLFNQYVGELRQAKKFAENWWAHLNQAVQGKEGNAPALTSLLLRERWPFGPASHPRVIATYRKYFFLCKQITDSLDAVDESAGSTTWGIDDSPAGAATVDPKVFVRDFLAGEETEDLYNFLMQLCFVPIGMKGDDLV